MLTAIVRFMRTHHLLPANDPPPRREGKAKVALRPSQIASTVHARGVAGGQNRHATREVVRREGRVEPAMAVIPRDVVQMPPVASPGLPPVDPVEVLSPPPSWVRAGDPNRSTAASGRAGQGGDSRSPVGPGTPCDDFSEFAGAGEDEASDPSQAFSEPVVRPLLSVGVTSFPKRASPPVAEDVEGYPGRVATGAVEDEERALAFSEGLHDPFMQSLEPIWETPVPANLEALDSLLAVVPSCATVGVRRRVPARIAARPDPTQWSDDELLTLPEAAAMFWPDGPITTNTLRTAGRDGALAITKVAGKFFTTPMAIRRMGLGEPAAEVRVPAAQIIPVAPEASFLAKIEETKWLARERKRRQRAAKRSVPSAIVGRMGQ